MHNGGIPGFDRMKRHLLAELGDEAYQAIEGTTDSEVGRREKENRRARFISFVPDNDFMTQEYTEYIRSNSYLSRGPTMALTWNGKGQETPEGGYYFLFQKAAQLRRSQRPLGPVGFLPPESTTGTHFVLFSESRF